MLNLRTTGIRWQLCFCVAYLMSLVAGCASVPEFIFKNQPILSIPAGKALIYFYRESSFQGGALTIDIHEGDAQIGRLHNGTYHYEYVDSGRHVFSPSARSIEGNGYAFTLSDGGVYFIKAEFVATNLWPFKSSVVLSMVDQAKARIEISNLREDK